LNAQFELFAGFVVVVAAPGAVAPAGVVVAPEVVAVAVVVLFLVVKRSAVYHLAFVHIAALEVDHALEFCHHLNAQPELFAGYVVVVAVRGWH